MKTVSKNQNRFPVIHDDLFQCVEKYIRQGQNGCSIIVPHVCNNINLFGAGFAAATAQYYPIVKENYHLLGNHFLKNNFGYTQFVEVLKDKIYGHKLIFANMIAQNGTISSSNARPLNYYALAKSMSSVAHYIQNNFDTDNRVQIHTPKFGCGLAGGDWNFVAELIKDIWYNTPVFVYSYK